ncbi:MAG: hypothetical protein AMXMBFR4_13890 [Candidatus Hydrogenedentota bacterium]
MRRHTVTSALPLITLLVATLCPAYAALQVSRDPRLVDDTYITLTYVKNLVAGNGFVFNHPPPTLGTTTPLNTFGLVALARLLPDTDIERLAVVFSTACWVMAAWLFYWFRHSWGLTAWQASLVGVMVSTWDNIAFLGTEAFLFAMLLILASSLFFAKRYALAGFVGGLMALTRGEGILVLPIMMAWCIVAARWPALAHVATASVDSDRRGTKNGNRRRRLAGSDVVPLLKLAAGFLPPIAAWCVYAYSTFGYVLPNTLAAKQAQVRSGLWPSFLSELIYTWPKEWGEPYGLYGVFGRVLWWALALIGLYAIFTRKRRFLLLALWTATYTAGYITLYVAGYWWYQTPIVFLLTLCVALGVVTCIDTVLRLRVPRRNAVVAASLMAAGSVFPFALFLVEDAAFYEGDKRARFYHNLARWVRENTQREDSIGYIEVGYLAYFTGNRIVDFGGLVTPGMTPYVRKADFANALFEFLPDYYIESTTFDPWLHAIKEDPRFPHTYRYLDKMRGPYNSIVTCYRRID